MSPVFASLGMKLAQTGVAKELAVKVSFVQFLTWNSEWVVQTDEILLTFWLIIVSSILRVLLYFSLLKTNNSAQLRTVTYSAFVYVFDKSS